MPATSKSFVLDSIPFEPDLDRLLLRLRFHFPTGDPGFETAVRSLLREVVPAARPKALYQVSRLTRRTPSSVEIEGLKFSSYLLRFNLDRAQRVFPFVVTCGTELESFRPGKAGLLSNYCLEVIKDLALDSAFVFLRGYLMRKFGLDLLYSLTPGEYHSWPASNIRPLLSLFSGAEQAIGVKLSGDTALLPFHSSCGLFYFIETEFENCQFCPRVCVGGRRAPFNPELAKKFPHRKGCAG